MGKNRELSKLVGASGGVYLGGTGAANLLDDVETGSWTPVWSDGTNSDATYTRQVGRYTKVGEFVHLQGYLSISALNTISGANLRITGVPFTSANETHLFSTMYVGWASGLNITAGQSVTGQVGANTAHYFLQLWDGAAGTSPLSATELSDNGTIIFTASYIAA